MPRDLKTRARALASVALPLLIAACAAGAAGERTQAEPEPELRDQPEPAPLQVVIENDLVPRTPVVVRFVAGAGTRTFLGSVEPGRAARFEIGGVVVGEAELTAEETVTGETHRSRRFVAHAGERVHWALRQNMIRITRQ